MVIIPITMYIGRLDNLPKLANASRVAEKLLTVLTAFSQRKPEEVKDEAGRGGDIS